MKYLVLYKLTPTKLHLSHHIFETQAAAKDYASTIAAALIEAYEFKALKDMAKLISI